jgi:hypothetical protein
MKRNHDIEAELEARVAIEELNVALLEASKQGDAERVKTLLKDPRANPSGLALHEAVWKGHTHIVKLFFEDPRTIIDKSSFLFNASYYGNTELMRMLLADPRVDPSVDENSAIKWAAIRGHDQVMRMLLADPRVNPLGVIPRATSQCARILAGHPRWGFEANQEIYAKHRSGLLRKYKDVLAQCLAMAWVTKQLPTWSDMVQMLTERFRAGFFE